MNGCKWRRRLLTAISISMFAAPAFAVSSLPSAWYLEGNVGLTFQPTTLENTPAYRFGCLRNVGYNVDLGYKINQYVAIELGYTNYATNNVYAYLTDPVDFDLLNGEGFYNIGYMQNYAYDLVGKFILPVYSTGLEVFGKLGVTRVMSNFSSTLDTLLDTYGENDEANEVVYTARVRTMLTASISVPVFNIMLQMPGRSMFRLSRLTVLIRLEAFCWLRQACRFYLVKGFATFQGGFCCRLIDHHYLRSRPLMHPVFIPARIDCYYSSVVYIWQ